MKSHLYSMMTEINRYKSSEINVLSSTSRYKKTTAMKEQTAHYLIATRVNLSVVLVVVNIKNRNEF